MTLEEIIQENIAAFTTLRDLWKSEVELGEECENLPYATKHYNHYEKTLAEYVKNPFAGEEEAA
tara:strand:+ start:804 stop:995 length:192 start_codon:yes stop_codon:yes gene_type:complete